MQDYLKNSLSLPEPEYNKEKKTTAPRGDPPIFPFRVVWDLYCENISLCKGINEGIWYIDLQ